MAHKLSMPVRILLVSILILTMGIAPALAATSIPAWINSSKATIYIGPNETTSLHAGTEVYITGAKKGWARISYKGHVGLVEAKYLTAVEGRTGYVRKRTYVYKSASTSSAKRGPLEVGTEVKVVGFNGNFCQVTNGKAYGYIPKGALSRSKPSDAAILASKVQPVNWSKGRYLLRKGETAYLYDIQTGLTVHVYRLGGSNHFELEPVSTEDTAKLWKMSGNKFSWSSRPVILIAHGICVPAAINTMPHGAQSIQDNGFNGQFCMHLMGSKTHGTEAVNVNHQAAIKYACAWVKAMT